MLFRLKAYGIAALGVLATILGAFWVGKREARREAREDALQDHIDTRKRIDEVSDPLDESKSRSWLHERGKR